MRPMITRAFRGYAACIVLALKLFESFAEGAGSVKLTGAISVRDRVSRFGLGVGW